MNDPHQRPTLLLRCQTTEVSRPGTADEADADGGVGATKASPAELG